MALSPKGGRASPVRDFAGTLRPEMTGFSAGEPSPCGQCVSDRCGRRAAVKDCTAPGLHPVPYRLADQIFLHCTVINKRDNQPNKMTGKSGAWKADRASSGLLSIRCNGVRSQWEAG
jgi:hypothetical protein